MLIPQLKHSQRQKRIQQDKSSRKMECIQELNSILVICQELFESFQS